MLPGLLLGLLLCSASALATTFVELSLDEMLLRAEVAFHGTVRSVGPEMRGEEPWTAVTFRVGQDFLADEAEGPATEITLLFLGGEKPDGTTVTVEQMPVFNTGDEVLLLAYAADYYSPVVGFNQGVWWLQPDGQWLDLRSVPLGVDTETGVLASGESAGADQVPALLAAELGAR
jgi:hypothetical protein